MGLIMNGFLKVPMQFFILLVGVMVFIFYQFESAPLHFNPKGVETVLLSSQADAYRALEEKHLATQKQRHSLLTANLDNTTLNQIALLYTKEQQQRQQAKALIEQADPIKKPMTKTMSLSPSFWGTYPKGLLDCFGCDSLRRHELYCV